MIRIVISPAKTLDFTTSVAVSEYSLPLMLEKSKLIADELRLLHPNDIEQLMSVSSKLAALNFERFQQWHLPFSMDNARQAIYAFDGDVYDGLSIRTLAKGQVGYLNERLRILSGLYGVLRPLDLIQPYRLEMGIKLPVAGSKNLYRFWGSSITDYLNNEFTEENPTLVNLASEEYFKSITPALLRARIVTPVFMEDRGERPRVIALMAKRARGSMVRFMAEQQIVDVENLKTFDYNGYCYNEELSEGDRWAFVR